MKDNFRSWELRIVNTKQLTKTQKLFGHAFYWAGFYGERKVINLFLDRIAISPFVKLIDGKNVVDALVEGWNYKELEYLIKDSRQQIYDKTSKTFSPDREKFILTNLNAS